MRLVAFSLSLVLGGMFLFCESFPCSIFSLARLYSWRYKRLGDLPHVRLKPEFQIANPGFWFEYQLINVEDYNGVGESEPEPHFFQVSEE